VSYGVARPCDGMDGRDAVPRGVTVLIQVPDAPFGLVWYQGDLVSDGKSNAKVTYIGRFSVESFIEAPRCSRAGDVACRGYQ
jgi:hypothetical protein